MRCEAGMRHLMRTQLGTFRADPRYGSPWEKMRTQGFNTAVADEAEALFRSSAATYLPDVSVHEVRIEQAVNVNEPPPNDTKVTVFVSWTIRGATEAQHGELARKKTSTVTV